MKSARPEKKQPQRPTATVAAKGAAKTMPVEPLTPVKRLKASIDAMAPVQRQLRREIEALAARLPTMRPAITGSQGTGS